MNITVVIPAFNESKKIAQVVRDVKKKRYQIVVVDDGSSDLTAKLAREAGATVLTHFLNRGQGAALQTGINFALNEGADILVTFDADDQLKVDEISQIIEPLLLGEVEVVLGSRFLNSENKVPGVKRFVLKLAIRVTNLYTGLRLTDTHNGFRAFSREAAQKIEIKQDGMAHASEIIEQVRQHKLKYKEVPVTMKYTQYSMQKGQKLSNSFSIVWDLIIGRISK